MPKPHVLTRFGPATQAWFSSAFAYATTAQIGAWKAISGGNNTLVIAPTGSGKTLAAFLWAIDRLASAPREQADGRRCRVLYISPLKALAVDIERNLRTPLAGIRNASALLGMPQPDITVGMRTGDTPANERRAFARAPQDILITTPESLFLLLTSAAREALSTVETVIIDEVHAVCGTKRGAHLALSLERLDRILPRPAQRIGLSATVRPVDETAQFLAGAASVAIVRPPATKTIEVTVEVPVRDMTDLDPPDIRNDRASGQRRASIWPAVEERVFDLIAKHRSTIVFANGRRGAERLCARLNELAATRHATGQACPTQHSPAEVMGQAGESSGAPPTIARAHHGSVSREERAHIEQALKAGTLPAVIATSSLELGIDMGAVDLVVQIEAPPSVAAGLQRIGRAGHHVSAVSRGVILPKHRGDLVSCAVVSERMSAGQIEELRFPRNPLDVLAQQIVAMVAMDDWRVDDLLALVRRSAPFAQLPDTAFRAVLDMLSGRYPSTAFAELRPRLVWDRVTDVLSGRPGSQRLAVTSGGTIPDRGLFGVFLASGQPADGAAGTQPSPERRPARVGELDEEMVYESRVGDVFLLGSTSWRIEDITHDRVLVSPAPGAPARMPFWKGDTPGRPVELGRAIGARLRGLSGANDASARERLAASGLDTWAVDNLVAYVNDQRMATRRVPDDRTIVVERFRDELGDWRLVIHCVLGSLVNAPWALAIARRVTERYGVDGQVVPADDGIVVRLPDIVDDPPGADLVVFDPDEIAAIVEESVSGSALFASRFRECAARALLLPRRDPRRRQPLWQQRQRAAQLLDVAREYPEFPITLEAARECLQDVFDVNGLVCLMRELANRKIRLVEVETGQPSPFARSLLFCYIGSFLYEGDAPLAERRAAALALDPTMLCELLGNVELRELLDPHVVASTATRLQWLTDERTPTSADGVAEMLSILGDLTESEATARGADPTWLADLEKTRRAIVVGIAGHRRWLAIEDAARVRDALGATLPAGIPSAYLEPVADPLGDLISRYARTNGPFTAASAAARFGLGVAVVELALGRLSASGRIVAGAFSPEGDGQSEWCDAEVLRLLRRRSLSALRKEIEPMPQEALARFLPVWHHIVPTPGHGADALFAAIEQLQGVPIPASALERLVLPTRVADYTPAYLDELCATGEVVWAGAGALPSRDGWIVLATADLAPLLLPPPQRDIAASEPHATVLAALGDGRALYFRQLRDEVRLALGTSIPDDDLVDAIWDLVWAGWIAGDTLTPLRSRLAGTGGTHRSRAGAPRSRYRRPGYPASLAPGRSGPPGAAGRWYTLAQAAADPTIRTTTLTDALLERHGIITRGAVMAEDVPGGFAAVYRVLSAMEDRGSVRRGYFVDGLGAAQFAAAGAIDQLRAAAGAIDQLRALPGCEADQGPRALVLAATDPANAFGAALPWPQRPADAGGVPPSEGGGDRSRDDGVPSTGATHRPGRKAGALVVLAGGRLVLYVERGGHSLLSYTEDLAVLTSAANALAVAVRGGALGALSVERADGEPINTSPLREALRLAGFRQTPRGLRIRA